MNRRDFLRVTGLAVVGGWIAEKVKVASQTVRVTEEWLSYQTDDVVRCVTTNGKYDFEMRWWDVEEFPLMRALGTGELKLDRDFNVRTGLGLAYDKETIDEWNRVAVIVKTAGEIQGG